MSGETLDSIVFSSKPSVLVLADGDEGLERGQRSALLSGCRTAGSERMEGAAARLDRQAAVDAVYLSTDHDSPGLENILDRIREGAESGAFGSVISAPLELIDAIGARVWHPRVQFVVEDDEVEQALALRLASTRSPHRLHDIGSEQGTPRLQQISEEVRRIASALERISAEEAQHADGPTRSVDGRAKPIDAGAVRAIIRARRLRDQFFGADLFADPAWDILLDLYAARLERQRVAVSSLCIAAAVPATTALRWIKTLTDAGLLVRTADPQDGRRVYIELAEASAEGMQAYLGAAQRISPLSL